MTMLINVLSYLSKEIQCVLDLVHLTGVLSFVLVGLYEPILVEDLSVVTPNIKDRAIVGPQVGLVFTVCGWPFIEIELERKQLAADKSRHKNTFLSKLVQVAQEQE